MTDAEWRARVIKRVKDRLEMMRRGDNAWADLYVRDEPRNRFTLKFPSVPSFLKRSVIQLTANSQMGANRFFLLCGGIDPVFECPYHEEILPLWANQ